MKLSKPALVVRYVILSLLAVFFLVPFYIVIRNSFSTDRWIFSPDWHWLGNVAGLDNIVAILSNPNVPILGSLLNSIIVAVVQTVGTVIISMMAGYALARFSGRAATIVLGLTLGTLMVPTTVTFVPQFVMVSSLGWISSFRGLIIPGLFSAFATYLFRTHFLGFPKELEEAAFIDGANFWTMFWRVVAPNSMGMVAAVGTITFINSWNAFLWPMLIGQDDRMRTIQVTLSRYMTSQNVQYPLIFAGALVTLIPTIIVFLFLQRHLVTGVEHSGID